MLHTEYPVGKKTIMYDSENSFWHFLKSIDPDAVLQFIIGNHSCLIHLPTTALCRI